MDTLAIKGTVGRERYLWGINSSLLEQIVSGKNCVRYGPCRSVGIGTGYGLDGPEFEFPWRENFSVLIQTIPVAHPAYYTMDT